MTALQTTENSGRPIIKTCKTWSWICFDEFILRCKEIKMQKRELSLSKDFAMLPEITAELVQTACKFESSSYAVVDEKRINLKSIMGVMSLVALSNKNLTLEIEGSDEEEAFTSLLGFWA